MAEPTIQEILQAELAKVPLPEGIELDVITSKKLVDRIIPLMTAFTRTNILEVQKVKDKTGESMAELAMRIMATPDKDLDVTAFVKDIQAGTLDGRWIDEATRWLTSNWLTGPLLTLVIAGLHIVTTVFAHASVSSEKTRQTANETIRPYLQDLNTLIRQYYRDVNSQLPVIKEMRKMGIPDFKITEYIDNAKYFLPVDILARLWHREEITNKEFNQGLRDNTLDESDIKRIKPALYVYPNVSDLVSFAVREVFSPELAAELGLYSDMPGDFISEAKKAGLKEEYAKMYWAAHWQPVPLGQAFEMFHRQVIDKKQLIDLIRVNDYMPNFREELVEISYSPILRIDLRRMYRSGLIDFEELVKGNMDLGYNEDDAEKIAIWTDEEYANENKEITKSDIISLYVLGHFTYQAAYDALIDTGYNEYSATDLLLKEDLKAAQKKQKRLISIYKKAYMHSTLEVNDIKANLLSAGLGIKEIDNIIADWSVERKEPLKYLSPKQIEDIFKNGIWEIDETSEYLLKIGYSEYDTQSLLTLWSIDSDKGE